MTDADEGAKTPSEAPEFDERATAIVLIGRFNPRILQPAWFEARGLMADVDVDPQSLILSDGLATFRTPIFGLLCDNNRCQFVTTSKTPTPDILRDLAIETFTLLNQTPIWEVGINALAHIPAVERSWDAVVTQLGEPQKSLQLLDGQTLATIELRGSRPDSNDGYRAIILQPSQFMADGVFLHLNDHVHLGERDEQIGASKALEVLNDGWKQAREYAESVIQRFAPKP